MTSRPSAASSTVRPNDADVVERRREGDEPVAAHASVRRLDADDAAERRRLSHRAAGLRAERDARDTGGDGRGRTARRSPGTRSGASGFFAGPNALFSVDEPIANSSMLDLATRIAPAARSLVTAVAAYGLTYPSRIFEPHDVGMTVVAMLSLMTTGTPSKRSALACRRTASSRARTTRVITVLI